MSLALKESSFVFGNIGVLYHRWKKIGKAKEAYEKLQNNLEIIAKAGAVDVPKHILGNILAKGWMKYFVFYPEKKD